MNYASINHFNAPSRVLLAIFARYRPLINDQLELFSNALRYSSIELSPNNVKSLHQQVSQKFNDIHLHLEENLNFFIDQRNFSLLGKQHKIGIEALQIINQGLNSSLEWGKLIVSQQEAIFNYGKLSSYPKIRNSLTPTAAANSFRDYFYYVDNLIWTSLGHKENQIQKKVANYINKNSFRTYEMDFLERYLKGGADKVQLVVIKENRSSLIDKLVHLHRSGKKKTNGTQSYLPLLANEYREEFFGQFIKYLEDKPNNAEVTQCLVLLKEYASEAAKIERRLMKEIPSIHDAMRHALGKKINHK